MGTREQKINILRKYKNDLKCSGNTFKIKFYNELTDKKIENARKAFGRLLQSDNILMFLDFSMWENGSEGLIISEDKLFYKKTLFDTVIIPFDAIKELKCEDCKIVFKILHREDVILNAGGEPIFHANILANIVEDIISL